ncbi:MAG TPA: hypothetical protein VLT62_19710 [Candidatus Methylomirabilis sp.]|nr:hypothetical protein [Candidatus Methylomirabilis sp.]
MSGGPQVHSLLPYLDDASGSLRICLVAQDLPTLERIPFPFLVASDADPFSLLIEAQFVTDAGSELKKVLLLVQRDAYPVGNAGSRPLTNGDIEQAWHRAYEFYLRTRMPAPPVVLTRQFTQSGAPASLEPVFYCKATKTYFHPPCPNCGHPLLQCEDDALLQRAGLQPYTGSLKRYLFCPSCSSAGPGGFYVKERVRTDPPTLSDREELIRAFGRFREKAEPDTRFPCPGCPHHAECYGPGNLATARIAALSFYPFHLLAFEAMSLCAVDFLALLSGARIEELAASLQGKGEQGRLERVRALGGRGAPGAPFLFEREERWFLEVLYLKLSFLGEVLRILVGESDILRHPEMTPCLDRLWVKVPEQCGLLPFLWNFRVQLIDIGSGTPGPPLLPDPSGSMGLHFLGLVWLEALLSNQRQGIGRVHDALRQAAETCPLEDERFVDRIFRGKTDPAFLPENVFWEPDGKRVDGTWNSLWERALHLGWVLLAGARRRGPEWSAEAFQASVESLRKDVRDALFPVSLVNVTQAVAAAAPVRPLDRLGAQGRQETAEPRPGEDETIRAILQRIHATWKAVAETPRQEPAEELEQTRFLQLGGTKQPPEPGPPQEKEGEDEVFVETVLLSSAEAPGRSPAAPAPPVPSAKEQGDQEDKEPEAEEEALEKTVFLDTAKLRGKGRDGSKK